MKLFRALTRLAWLDLRLAQAFIGISILIPAVLFYLVKQYDQVVFVRNVLSQLPVFLVSFMVVLWATGKTGNASSKITYEFRFPVSPKLTQVTRFVLSLALTAVLGAWFGICLSRVSDGRFIRELCIDSAIFFSAVFVCCYVLSCVFPRFTVILAGLIWSLICSTSTYDWMKAGLPDAWKMNLLVRLIIAGLIAMAFIGGRTTKVKYRLQLVGVITLLFIASAFPNIILLVTKGHWSADSEPQIIYWSTISTQDGSLTAGSSLLLSDRKRQQLSDNVGIRCRDHRTSKKSRWILSKDAGIFDAHPNGKIFIVQQLPENPAVHIFLANCVDHSMQEIARFRARKGILLRTLQTDNSFRQEPNSTAKFTELMYTNLGSVSPDGSRILLILASPLGQGLDLWAIDTKNHRYRVVRANYDGYSLDEVVFFSWGYSTAYVSSSYTAVAVDFGALTARSLNVALKSGE